MSNILSLSKARKAKARAEREATAEQNRILFGRTKAEKQQAQAEKALTVRRIEAHRRETGELGTHTPDPDKRDA
jgi:Domain of unknown function (DUF4169)